MVASVNNQVHCTGDILVEDTDKIKMYSVQAKEDDDPDLHSALKSKHKPQWLIPLQEEIKSLSDNDVFSL
jgi:hypothetical protein